MSLSAAFASPRSDEREAACRDAGRDPSAVVWIDLLARALGDDAGGVRNAASDTLAALGRVHDVKPALKRALHGDDARARFGAAHTWTRLAPPDPVLIPAAVEALASAEGAVRWRAARILVELGRLHDDVPALVLGLARAAESPEVRRMALFCLRELSPDGDATRAALLEALEADDAALRRAALTALAGLLDPPASLLGTLARVAHDDPDATCRELATRATASLGHRGAPA